MTVRNGARNGGKRLLSLLLLAALVFLLAVTLTGCGKKTRYFHSIDEMKNADRLTVGILAGTCFSPQIKSAFPNAEIVEFPAEADCAEAVRIGKIDAYVADQTVAEEYVKDYPTLCCLPDPIGTSEYAFPCAVTPFGETLRSEISAFIGDLKTAGMLDGIFDAWNNGDTEQQVTDYAALPATNGTIRVATDAAMPPFSMVREGEVVGIDVDILTRFAKAKGYAIDIEIVNFNGVLAGLGTRSDLAIGAISVTDERKESVDFTASYCDMDVVLTTRKDPDFHTFGSLADFNDPSVTLGAVNGSAFQDIFNAHYPEAKVLYYKSYPDLAQALSAGVIDGYIVDDALGRYAVAQTKGLKIFPESMREDPIAYLIARTPKGAKIKTELNAYLAKIKANGTLDEIDAIWFGTDNSKKKITIPTTGVNGTLHMVTNSGAAPFGMILDGKPAGFDVDLISRFCAEYGYAMTVEDVDVDSLVTGITTGVYDVGGCCLTATAERAESADFSDSYYTDHIVMAVRTGEAKEKIPLGERIRTGFEKTFIREDRWKMILSGLGVTLIITVFAAVIGTVLGFGICVLRLRKNRFLHALTTGFIRILQGTPILVILMIFYYVIFSDVGISGVAVSVIAFSLNFAAYVSEMIRTGIEAVDRGQTEAALALGYTPTRAFFHIVLPQAARHFLPVYRGELIALLKSTSIVGYIAVQDLTKVSELIRSRTFEAFFPLIATAIVYFLLSRLLTYGLTLLERKTEPDRKNRMPKGVMKP